MGCLLKNPVLKKCLMIDFRVRDGFPPMAFGYSFGIVLN